MSYLFQQSLRRGGIYEDSMLLFQKLRQEDLDEVLKVAFFVLLLKYEG